MALFSRDLTVWFLLVAFISIVTYNVAAVMYFSPGSTISEVLLAIARAQPLLPLLAGILLGHLFWPQVPGGKLASDPSACLAPPVRQLPVIANHRE